MTNQSGSVNWWGMLLVIMVLFLLGAFALMQLQKTHEVENEFEAYKAKRYKQEAPRLEQQY